MPYPKPVNYLTYMVSRDRLLADYYSWCSEFDYEPDTHDVFVQNLKVYAPNVQPYDQCEECATGQRHENCDARREWVNLRYEPNGVVLEGNDHAIRPK